MTAGVTFGSAEVIGPDADQTVTVTTGFEEEVWQPGSDGADGMLRTSGMRATLAAILAGRRGHVHGDFNRLDRRRARWTAPLPFPKASLASSRVRDLGDGVSQHTALAAAAAAVALDPTVAATLTVMPVSALLDSEPTPL